MGQVAELRDFLVGSFLVIALLPIMGKALNIVAPNLGSAETLVISLIPLAIGFKWIRGFMNGLFGTESSSSINRRT